MWVRVRITSPGLSLERECVFRSIGLGLEGTGSHRCSLMVAWQGAFGADRSRGSGAAAGQVCSVVAWPCPICLRGSCQLDLILCTKRDPQKNVSSGSQTGKLFLAQTKMSWRSLLTSQYSR